MFQIFRVQKLLLDRYSHGRRQPLHEAVELSLRVLPDDLDLNFHMNNSRYLKLMDLGRWQFIMRTGLMETAIRKRWKFVAGAIDITYLRPLKLFQEYTLRTRVECWDDKWLIIEQRFLVAGRAHARARVRMLLQDRQQRAVPTEKIFTTLPWETRPSPEPSERTRLWLDSLLLREH